MENRRRELQQYLDLDVVWKQNFCMRLILLRKEILAPLNKNNVFRRKTKKTKITNSEIFKETIPIVNQYVNRIFRALDEKGLVRYD